MTTNTTNVAVPVAQAKSPSDLARTFGPTLFGTELRVLLLVFALIVAWGLAIATWGYPALIIVALCLVPVMFTVLLLITVGK
ncbi:MAG: hypothetical protein ABNH38_09375 [Tateyamaria sp.]|jgi:fatty acid desaturase|uniref:hypothetical protein n=1 Tax=Tateyamaria sp. TaxID=1929288 RepID=UPI0032DDCA55